MNFTDSWNKNYDLAKKYYEYYGNLNIKRDFRTINGVDYDENGIQLGRWLYNQVLKLRKGVLDNDKVEKLAEIGFVLKKRRRTWNDLYEELKSYYNEPEKTLENIKHTENKVLYNWVEQQKKLYRLGKLKEEKIQRLSDLGIDFESKKFKTWNKYFLYAKNYYNYYGNLNVPKDFKTNDGINYLESGNNLWSWLYKQYNNYQDGILNPEKVKMLESIGLVESFGMDKWLKKYEMVKKYFKHYGNLDIPNNFRTCNGIDYDENGEFLDKWFLRQKALYKKGLLSQDKILRLESLGIIWNNKKNRDDIIALCIENKINYELNKPILLRISCTEFSIKIKFLNAKGIKIQNNYGYLHELFYISSIRALEKYDFNLEIELEKEKENLYLALNRKWSNN